MVYGDNTIPLSHGDIPVYISALSDALSFDTSGGVVRRADKVVDSEVDFPFENAIPYLYLPGVPQVYHTQTSTASANKASASAIYDQRFKIDAEDGEKDDEESLIYSPDSSCSTISKQIRFEHRSKWRSFNSYEPIYLEDLASPRVDAFFTLRLLKRIQKYIVQPPTDIFPARLLDLDSAKGFARSLMYVGLHAVGIDNVRDHLRSSFKP